MAKIYVHIGLPKTATTTLQKDLFPNLNNPEIKYYGVIQPRVSPQNAFFQQFYNTIGSGENIDEMISTLEKELAKGTDILLSDEMIVVSTKHLGWQKKLKILSAILKPFDYQLIVTVREPVNAMFSYYTQLFRDFSATGKSFREIALEDRRMKIYHYKTFFQYLLSLFSRDRIFIKRFEDIIENNNDDLIALLDSAIGFQDKQLLKDHNPSTKTEDSVIVNHSFSLERMIRKCATSLGLNGLFRDSGFKPIIRKFLSGLGKIQTSRKYTVGIPEEELFKDLRKSLMEETSYLKDTFGINYCDC